MDRETPKRVLQMVHRRICIFFFLFCFCSLAAANGLADSIPWFKAQAFYYENRLKHDTLEGRARVEVLEKLQSIYQSLGQSEDLYQTQKEVLDLLQEEGTPVEALSACQGYLAYLQGKAEWDRADSLQYAELQLKMGVLSIRAGLYDEGASYMLDLLKMDAPDWCAAQACSYLGYIFMRNGRMGKSMEYHRKAEDLYLAHAGDSLMSGQGALVYNHLGGWYYAGKQYDSAIGCLEKAIACSEKGSSNQLYAYHNMALIYMELGEYAKAEEYLDRTVLLAGQADNHYLKAVALQNLAELYKDLHRDAASMDLFRQALDLAGRMHFNDILAGVMIGYADLLFETGDCEGFRKYYTAGVAKRDSVTGVINQERVDLLNFKYESYRMESERRLLEQDLAMTTLANQKKTVVVISLGVLLLLATLLMFRMISKIRRQAKENLSMNARMDHIRSEMERQETDSRNLLNSSMEQKNRELASRALYMVQVNDILQRTLASLERLERADGNRERKELLAGMRKEIKEFDGNVSGWKDFRLYFEQIHQGFYTRLLAAVPNLSPVEQRLCALLASNLTQKEIAEITNRSLRTIETMVYRIRKKFQIPTTVNMSVFLQQFLQD